MVTLVSAGNRFPKPGVNDDGKDKTGYQYSKKTEWCERFHL